MVAILPTLENMEVNTFEYKSHGRLKISAKPMRWANTHFYKLNFLKGVSGQDFYHLPSRWNFYRTFKKWYICFVTILCFSISTTFCLKEKPETHPLNRKAAECLLNDRIRHMSLETASNTLLKIRSYKNKLMESWNNIWKHLVFYKAGQHTTGKHQCSVAMTSKEIGMPYYITHVI